jgi:hypothetical protein
MNDEEYNDYIKESDKRENEAIQDGRLLDYVYARLSRDPRGGCLSLLIIPAAILGMVIYVTSKP